VGGKWQQTLLEMRGYAEQAVILAEERAASTASSLVLTFHWSVVAAGWHRYLQQLTAIGEVQQARVRRLRRWP
jgi:hypothetical protein